MFSCQLFSMVFKIEGHLFLSTDTVVSLNFLNLCCFVNYVLFLTILALLDSNGGETL